MSRAEYMRAYRAKKRGTPSVAVETPDLGDCGERVAFLESEVARLKRELAARPQRNPFAEFRPALKPGRK